MNVWAKLLKVQAELKAPKNKYSKYGDYNYRSCEGILESAKPLLQEVGAVLLLSDRVEEIAGRFYIVAHAAFVDAATGERVEVEARARETETRPKFDDAQLTGAASSYARKYALSGLLGVDDGADVDALPASGSDGRSSGGGRGDGKAAAGAGKTPAAHSASASSAATQRPPARKQGQSTQAAAPPARPEQSKRAQTVTPPPKPAQGQRAQELINEVQAQLLTKAAERNGVALESILRRFGVTDLMRLPEKHYREQMGEFQRQRKESGAGGSGGTR